jgi:hypothetical protein
MPSRYNLPHIEITAFGSAQAYAGEGFPNAGAVRIRDEHGKRLQHELRVALTAADETRPADERLAPPTGTFLEVELRRGTPADALDMKTRGIRTGAAKVRGRFRPMRKRRFGGRCGVTGTARRRLSLYVHGPRWRPVPRISILGMETRRACQESYGAALCHAYRRRASSPTILS